MRKAKQLDLPTPAKSAPPKWLLLGLLMAGAFGLTYALVVWSRGPGARPAGGPSRMVWIPGGEFTMGTDRSIGGADEKPAHPVRVDGFWMDETDVTNEQFRTFVEATNYVTTAEKPVNAEEILRQRPPAHHRHRPRISCRARWSSGVCRHRHVALSVSGA
jgi:hypothetical protein